MRRATGPDNLAPQTFVRRLGEGGYGPGDGRVGTLDLLARSGLPVPEGFVLTAEGHREFLCARDGGPVSPPRGRGLGEMLEREVRVALLELGARTVAVVWGRGTRRGLGTIPAVVAAVRQAWTLAPPDGAASTWPVVVQRQARLDLSGWTTTADLSGGAGPGDAPLRDVGPGRRGGSVSALTRRAAGVLGEDARLGWGLEDGRWLLVSVEKG